LIGTGTRRGEQHRGALFPRVGFIVTNLRGTSGPGPRKHIALQARLTIALSGGQVYGICQLRSKNGNIGLLAATTLFILLGKVNFRVRGMIAQYTEEVRRSWKLKGKSVKLLERFGKC
jgi:hypothetical protein